jgi:hypothetical protein
MIIDVKLPAKECTCDICGYQWVSLATIQPPECCRSLACRSREWNGKKMPSYAKVIKLPAPRKGGRPKTITLLDEDEPI